VGRRGRAYLIKGGEDYRAHRIREEGVKGSQNTSWVRLGREEGSGAQWIKGEEDYRVHRIREEGGLGLTG
jgi:hypothetical protein